MPVERVRAAYLRWLVRAAPSLLLPLALTALVQAVASTEWWSSGPPPDGSARYLFLAVGVASVVVGRDLRRRDGVERALDLPALRSLSWKLLVFALAPVVIGAALAFMTRQVFDFYAMLVVTLAGLAWLFPRFDQWASWATAPPEGP
jgi:hypothetical protein